MNLKLSPSYLSDFGGLWRVRGGGGGGGSGVEESNRMSSANINRHFAS